MFRSASHRTIRKAVISFCRVCRDGKALTEEICRRQRSAHRRSCRSTSICSFRRRKTRLQNRSHSWMPRCSSSKACLSANWMVKTARPARTVNKATLSPTIPFAGRASPRIIWFACGRFTRRFTHSLWKRRSPDGSASKLRRSPPHSEVKNE